MTAWKNLRGDTAPPAEPGCILVRRVRSPGKWAIEIAYFTVSARWSLAGGGDIERFEQWADIPT
jgi:protein involved in polysaccharide export with SLBB domain